MQTDLAEELSLARELADLADGISMQRGNLSIRRKHDGSPVTEVDVAIERALRARLGSRRPGHAITGEEFGETGSSDWRWYLDPIDGTVDYITGGTSWTTLISLAYREQPRVAVIAAPVIGRRWWAVHGQGAFRDGRRLRVSTTARLRDAAITDDWRRTLARGVRDHPLARVARAAGRVVPRAGHSFLRVAAGEIDLAVGVGGFAWDYMPLKLLVEEAGGCFTDLRGTATAVNRDALVSNGRLHAEALRAITAPGL